MYVVYTTLFQWLHCAISLFAFCRCNFFYSAEYIQLYIDDGLVFFATFYLLNSFMFMILLRSALYLPRQIRLCHFIFCGILFPVALLFRSEVTFHFVQSFLAAAKARSNAYKWKSLRIRCEISHSQINHKSLLQIRAKWVRCIFKIHLKTEKIVSKDNEYASCAYIFINYIFHHLERNSRVENYNEWKWLYFKSL